MRPISLFRDELDKFPKNAYMKDVYTKLAYRYNPYLAWQPSSPGERTAQMVRVGMSTKSAARQIYCLSRDRQPNCDKNAIFA